jgi:hypothetical protein
MRTRECQSRYPLDKIKAKIKVANCGIVDRHKETDRICDRSFVE